MNTELLIPPCLESTSYNHRRNLPTPPSSPPTDLNDSSSCSTSSVASQCSASATTISFISSESNPTELVPCNLLNIISDVRFRPIFQAIEEIKGRKCRPDFERILKCIAKQSSGSNRSQERQEVLLVLDDLLKLGLVTKVFHKGGFTIRIKNEKYAKLIEKMNICYNQKTPTTTPMSPRQALAAAVTGGVIPGYTQPWTRSKDSGMHSNGMELNEQRPRREISSTALAVLENECIPDDSLFKRNGASQTTPVINGMVLETSSNSTAVATARRKVHGKRNRSQTPSLSNRKKASLEGKPLEPMVPSTSVLTAVGNNDRFPFLEPFISHTHLPPVTIEQLLGLRGDVPDVHTWSTNELSEFFGRQGFDYASSVVHKQRLTGDDMYRLRREEVLHMKTLKLGQALKLWNVIDQIQRNDVSSS